MALCLTNEPVANKSKYCMEVEKRFSLKAHPTLFFSRPCVCLISFRWRCHDLFSWYWQKMISAVQMTFMVAFLFWGSCFAFTPKDATTTTTTSPCEEGMIRTSAGCRAECPTDPSHNTMYSRCCVRTLAKDARGVGATDASRCEHY